MAHTTTTERQLLELAAQATGFEYMLYAPQTYHLRSGLLYNSPNGRTRTWNPLTDDGDLLQLAVAAPSISLQHIIFEASRIEATDDAARRAYVREHFVRAVTRAGLAMAETVIVVNNDSPVPTP
jgi:hypothetical protein